MTHLCEEISEMVSHINTLEMEIVNLKEDNEKSDKHFGQGKTDDDMSTSLPKVRMYVHTYMLMDSYNYIWFY